VRTDRCANAPVGSGTSTEATPQFITVATGTCNLQKRVATCQARAALAGVTLYVADDDHGRPLYIATRGPVTCQLSRVSEVELWLDRVEDE